MSTLQNFINDFLQSTTDDDPTKPKWWWESWQIDGPRKRKPTQLYEAGPSSPPGAGPCPASLWRSQST